MHTQPTWNSDQPNNNLLPNKCSQQREKTDTYLMFQGKAVTRNNGHKEICKDSSERVSLHQRMKPRPNVR